MGSTSTLQSFESLGYRNNCMKRGHVTCMLIDILPMHRSPKGSEPCPRRNLTCSDSITLQSCTWANPKNFNHIIGTGIMPSARRFRSLRLHILRRQHSSFLHGILLFGFSITQQDMASKRRIQRCPEVVSGWMACILHQRYTKSSQKTLPNFGVSGSYGLMQERHYQCSRFL